MEVKLARIEEQVKGIQEDLKEIKESVDFLQRSFMAMGFRMPPSPPGSLGLAAC